MTRPLSSTTRDRMPVSWLEGAPTDMRESCESTRRQGVPLFNEIAVQKLARCVLWAWGVCNRRTQWSVFAYPGNICYKLVHDGAQAAPVIKTEVRVGCGAEFVRRKSEVIGPRTPPCMGPTR